MSSYIIWILLLSIWHLVLFFGKSYGISVILFLIPTIIFLLVFLKKNKLIKNKYGLLFLIPALLLGCTYTLYDNYTFKFFNFMAIIGLFALTHVYTIKGVNSFEELFEDVFKVIFAPITYIGKFFRVSTARFRDKVKFTPKTKKVLKSLLIVVPVLIVVLLLLSNADMIFGNIFNKVFDKIGDFLVSEIFNKFFARLISFIFIFFVLGVSFMYLLFEYSKDKHKEIKEDNKKRDLLTIKILVISLNVIYVIFDFIQIKSLMLHSVASNINYAEYARQGFFELMVVSFINLAVILISKKFENNSNKKEFKLINIMSVIMVVLTMVIIVSSFLRMNLYENAFGYTTLRLLVYITLITEAILMIPTTMYIFNKDFVIYKSYLGIILVAYLFVNFINIDYLVARKNVDRFYNTNKVDVEYLQNGGTDNIDVLVELYGKLEEGEDKHYLGIYLADIKRELKEENSIFEFNYSKYKAKKALEGINIPNSELIEDYHER